MIKLNYRILTAVLFALLSISTLLIWNAKNINSITGDEPHYLIMTKGLIDFNTFEQTLPYQSEFNNKELIKGGLANPGEIPTPDNTHGVVGPHGLYNVHNIGLPLLLVMPYMLGGVFMAKIFMIAFASLIVWFSWKIADIFIKDYEVKLCTVVLCTFSAGLIPAANQIFPDIPAGVIALIGLYWVVSGAKRTLFKDISYAITVACLPWLQIKLTGTMIVIFAAKLFKIYKIENDVKKIIILLSCAISSLLLLAAYNQYAFGKLSGPYHDGALSLGGMNLLVFLGLMLDQNQGLLFQNPFFWIGVLGFGIACKENRLMGFVLILVFLSLLVPNALHPIWYGGWSFSGRFGLSASISMIVPTIIAVGALFEKRKKSFNVLFAILVVVQAYLFYRYAIEGRSLYNRNDALHEVYSIYYFPIDKFLPMLYSPWGYQHFVNYLWVAFLVALVVLGFLSKKIIARKLLLVSIPASVVLLVGIVNADTRSEVITYLASGLPSNTGYNKNDKRMVIEGKSESGYINYGPYVSLRGGRYKVELSYLSDAPIATDIGTFDIWDATDNKQLLNAKIHGTDSSDKSISYEFTLYPFDPHKIEFRTYWNGVANMTLNKINLTKIK